MENRKIDINQRIPLFVLQTGLEEHLNGNYDQDYILEQLQTEYSGANRLNKSIAIVNRIIINNPLNDFVMDHKEEILLAMKNKHDKGLVLISLLSASYRFAYDTLQFFGRFLSVQDIVKAEVINTSLSNIYGGNRATENAMYSVVPMFLEAEMLLRPKVGIYKLNPNFKVVSNIAPELYIESFKVFNSLVFSRNDFMLHPYFLWLKK
jgi:hypothetical protein